MPSRVASLPLHVSTVKPNRPSAASMAARSAGTPSNSSSPDPPDPINSALPLTTPPCQLRNGSRIDRGHDEANPSWFLLLTDVDADPPGSLVQHTLRSPEITRRCRNAHGGGHGAASQS